MNIYRIYPGLDAFKINGAYVPYLDIIADGPVHAVSAACLIMPEMNGTYSQNNISGNPEFVKSF